MAPTFSSRSKEAQAWDTWSRGKGGPRQRFGNNRNNNKKCSGSCGGGGGGGAALVFGDQSKLNGNDPVSLKYHQPSRCRNVKIKAQIRWARMSRLQRRLCAGLAAVALTAIVLHRYMYRSGSRYGYGAHWRHKMLRFDDQGPGIDRGDEGIGGGGSRSKDAPLLGRGQGRGIIQWELDRTGRDPSRDALVDWWMSHPEAPVGLSCAAFGVMMEDEEEDGREDDVLRQSMSTAAAASTQRKPKDAGIFFYRGYDIAPPVFPGRVPETGGQERVQVAFVMPFVEFQFVKVEALLTEHWARFPPCRPNTPRQSADLIFFTENPLSPGVQRRIRLYYAGLGAERTGCFQTDEPIFLSLTAEVNPEMSHLEGAAFTFYSLFRLLEKRYQTFVLAEPDVAPVQPNFLPALVKKSLSVNCEADGFWQIGSPPLTKDVDAGMLRERVDYHMNGNAIYVLGCAEFEEYKCRVQSFYFPKDDCELVAGECRLS